MSSSQQDLLFCVTHCVLHPRAFSMSYSFEEKMDRRAQEWGSEVVVPRQQDVAQFLLPAQFFFLQAWVHDPGHGHRCVEFA